MSSRQYVIRTYRPDDFDSYVMLHVEAEKFDRIGRRISRQALAESLRHPKYSPESDLFVAEMEGGEMAGCISLYSEPGIGRAVISYLVHPEYRAGDTGQRLFLEAVQRASIIGARLAHVNISESDTTTGILVAGLSFRPVRRFLELTLDLSAFHSMDGSHKNYTIRHFRRGEENLLAEMQNRSFAGTWGYDPNTAEEIAYWVNLSNCRPEGIIFVCDEDRPVGYCWITVNEEESFTGSAAGGRIYMIGVEPDYRGMGVGRRALLAGLSYLENRGIEVAGLTVDSGNREACALYESAGFRIRLTSTWYEKVLG